ncbi:MAG: 3-hydroxyacyl-CoA dehydrogenase NAD-binding domain-containing protein [Thermomicrobiaceae bacterium]
MDITRVAVIGAGTMGAGITQVVAQSGIPVTLIDQDASILSSAVDRIGAQFDRAVERERLSRDEADVALSVIDTDTAMEGANDVDLVIEAVPEEFALKSDIFRQLDGICKKSAILASNTSSISITQLGGQTNRPELVVGMHFFNPVPRMSLVEVVSGGRSGDAVIAAVSDFAKHLGKTPVLVQDFPGFVSNRVLIPMINEAIFCFNEGVAGIAEIDSVMKLGMNHPMGPLELADMIGLDVCLNILNVLQQELGDPKYRPCPLLRQMVAAGKLGQKTGEGFYSYDR